MGAPAAGGTQRWEIVLRADVGNVERAMLAHPAKLWLINTDLDAAEWVWDQNEPAQPCVPLAESQHHVIDPTNPRGALDDGVEDRLHVRGRAADDAEHLGRCRLMLQRLAQFCVALASSLNSRTFSMAITAWSAKVSEQLDLFVREGTNLRTADIDHPDGNSLAQQRRRQSTYAMPIAIAYGLLSGKLGFELAARS